MTTLQTMYDGQANSPVAELTAPLTSGATSATVDNAAILPAAPMLLVIGASSASAETVLLTNKPGSNVLTITRAQDGTTAREWPAGTTVQRCPTAYDHNTFIDNLEALNSGKSESDHNHDGVYEPADADIQSHLSNTSNPHSVTASQTGAVDKVTTGDKIQLYGVNASNAQTMYDVDIDLSSVSENDDTIPSAKAVKAVTDKKQGKIYQGTTSTAAATAEKAVTASNYTEAAGELLVVFFDNINTAASPKLNVNSGTARDIYYNGAAASATVVPKHAIFRFNSSNRYELLNPLGAAFQVATGSYTGTGTFGSENPCTLSFSFIPKLVLITSSDVTAAGASTAIFIHGTANQYSTFKSANDAESAGASVARQIVTWDDDATPSVSWYQSQSAKNQMNIDAKNYYYIAIA